MYYMDREQYHDKVMGISSRVKSTEELRESVVAYVNREDAEKDKDVARCIEDMSRLVQEIACTYYQRGLLSKTELEESISRVQMDIWALQEMTGMSEFSMRAGVQIALME